MKYHLIAVCELLGKFKHEVLEETTLDDFAEYIAYMKIREEIEGAKLRNV